MEQMLVEEKKDTSQWNHKLDDRYRRIYINKMIQQDDVGMKLDEEVLLSIMFNSRRPVTQK